MWHNEKKEAPMRVAEVMTRDVLTFTPQTSLKQVAELLAERGISGAPVVDDERHVLGVVSEADVILKERGTRELTVWQRLVLDATPAADRAAARTAGEAMTSPAITITPEGRVDHAAALMLDRAVNRLPVVDRDGTLVGLVTRADLVRAFVRTDEQIERGIREDVLVHELWLDPREFRVSVERGEVRVEGGAGIEAEADLLSRRIALVPGVVSVEVQAAALVG
jgi:CBS domain-containing protein